METDSAETRKREQAFIQAFHMDRNLGGVAIRNKLTLQKARVPEYPAREDGATANGSGKQRREGGLCHPPDSADWRQEE